MSLCIETICIRNGSLQNLSGHNERFNRTRLACWQLTEPARLEDSIQLPDWLLPTKTYKCRVTYGPAIEQVEVELYEVRPVHSLRVIVADSLCYPYKFADRQALNVLFAQRGPADDMLLVREGLLTDTSYANVALFDGIQWFTPARPLLEGTQRARLLREGRLAIADIRPSDLPNFIAIKLINAMLDWEQTSPISIKHIVL